MSAKINAVIKKQMECIEGVWPTNETISMFPIKTGQALIIRPIMV